LPFGSRKYRSVARTCNFAWKRSGNARWGCACCPVDLSAGGESRAKFEARPLSGYGVKVWFRRVSPVAVRPGEGSGYRSSCPIPPVGDPRRDRLSWMGSCHSFCRHWLLVECHEWTPPNHPAVPARRDGGQTVLRLSAEPTVRETLDVSAFYRLPGHMTMAHQARGD
jgi:hypothetical protein